MASHAHPHPAHATQVVKDPVCGMNVDPAQTEFSSEHDGETFYFCSAHCKGRFEADPAAFTDTGDSTGDSAHAGQQHAHGHDHGHDHGHGGGQTTPPTAADDEVVEWTCP